MKLFIKSSLNSLIWKTKKIQFATKSQTAYVRPRNTSKIHRRRKQLNDARYKENSQLRVEANFLRKWRAISLFRICRKHYLAYARCAMRLMLFKARYKYASSKKLSLMLARN